LISPNQNTNHLDGSNDIYYEQPVMDRSNEDTSVPHPDINYCSTIEIDLTSSQLNDLSVVHTEAMAQERKTFNMDLSTNISVI
jgi:hypothetical protein